MNHYTLSLAVAGWILAMSSVMLNYALFKGIVIIPSIDYLVQVSDAKHQ